VITTRNKLYKGGDRSELAKYIELTSKSRSQKQATNLYGWGLFCTLFVDLSGDQWEPVQSGRGKKLLQ